MDREAVRRILGACEAALEAEGPVDLHRLGFWRAVEAVKRHPDWLDEFARRIASIDRRAFQRQVWIRLPLTPGLSLLAAGAGVGAGLVVGAFGVPAPARGVLLLAGAGALLATTHDLAHYLVGRAVGIGFTDLYVLKPLRPQPGIKVDYESYLRAPPMARAWMHASGALVTKLIPFLVIPVALAARAPRWTIAVLLALGVVQILTDLLLSTRSSDWKRVRRELRHARRQARRPERRDARHRARRPEHRP